MLYKHEKNKNKFVKMVDIPKELCYNYSES